MSAIKGHSSQKRISTKGSSENFLSVHKLDHNKGAIDSLPKACYPVDPLGKIAEDIGTVFPQFKDAILKIVKLTGHTVRIGDLLRFRDGLNEGLELSVDWVDTDHIYLGGELISDPTGAEFLHMRAVSHTAGDKDGGLLTSSAPVRFLQDGIPVTVTEDTVTPANNIPLPTHDSLALDEQLLQNILLTNIDANIEELATKKKVVESVFAATAALTTAGFFPVGSVVPVGGLSEIEVLYKEGSTVEIFDNTGGVSLGMVTQAGGKIPVDVAAGSLIHLQVKGADVTVDDLTVNLIQ